MLSPALNISRSVKQVLTNFIDLQTYVPAEPLCRWLSASGIDNNGILDGEEETLAIVPASQKHFQRYHPDGTPMARTEIDIHKEDSLPPVNEELSQLQSLIELGLFYHRFALLEQPLDILLWHAAYLPELFLQFDTLVRYWKAGVRWEQLVFLGAEQSVGEDRAVDQILTLYPHHEHRNELRDVYNQTSLFWYAPCARIVKQIWQQLPMSNEMRQVDVRWIASPDRQSADGSRRLANTQDTLASFKQDNAFDPTCRYGLCTRSPTALRQWLITVMWMHVNGFSPSSKLPVICAPHARPISLWVAGREASNVLWELKNMKRLGITLAGTSD